tara:strand:+ start:179 stop:418 length:240 start_codon:yes stop_codon:yes gene_type:complete
MSSQYITDMGDQSIDISATERKFQTSIIVKQDPNKSGILSFLEQVEREVPGAPSETYMADSMLPGQQQGGGSNSQGTDY